ncbi:MAG TPA: hypothetical protein VI583_14900 [Cyclobacteriaceae bacterium]|nr:hypothetical protein [Cyclobacteriaceae bacterium]
MAICKYPIFLLTIFINPDIVAQEITFGQQDASNEAFRMKVKRNDRVLIAEDSAYIYSPAMVEKIRELERRYLLCLTDREIDLQQVKTLLASLGESYSNVNDLLNRSNEVSNAQMEEYQRKIGSIINSLEQDIATLNQLEIKIAGAEEELENIRQEVRKERRRLWWKKTGSIILAAAGGLAIGFLIGSS